MRCEVACYDKNVNAGFFAHDLVGQVVGAMDIGECKYAHRSATSSIEVNHESQCKKTSVEGLSKRPGKKAWEEILRKRSEHTD
jgi:hypothetical protein